MERFESEFEERLDALDRDSPQSAIFAYIQAALDYEASDFKVLDPLNRHADFWNAWSLPVRSG